MVVIYILRVSHCKDVDFKVGCVGFWLGFLGGLASTLG